MTIQTATIYPIIGRENERTFSKIERFKLGDGTSFDADLLLTDATISLYCIDVDKRQAVFVKLPPNTRLQDAPFYYDMQFEHATDVITLDFADFYILTENIDFDQTKLIIIHTIGRAGSTLLSKAFHQLDNVLSYSEPDVFTNIAQAKALPNQEIRLLLDHCMRYVFRPAVVGDFEYCTVKFRGLCTQLIDDYCTVFPESKHLFLYRNAVDWVTSMYRLRLRSDRPLVVINREEEIQGFADFMPTFRGG